MSKKKLTKIRLSIVEITHKQHRIPAIYLIRNKINGKVYVGQTSDLYYRYKSHEGSAKLTDKYNRPLILAFKKYGFNSFEFSILEKPPKDKKILTEREQYWMDKFQCYKPDKGYNACPAANSPLGYKHTEETKRKVSIASSKRKMSPEARRKISNSNKGKKLSDETKRKISVAQKGIKRGHTNGNKIVQLNDDKEILAEFKSITLASIEIGTHLSGISKACKNPESKAGGFYWRNA